MILQEKITTPAWCVDILLTSHDPKKPVENK